MTSDLRTAAQQALEALESADWYINQLEQIVYSDDDTDTHEERAKVQAAVTALRAALAEPVQEPVAWMFVDDTGMRFVSVERPHKDFQPLYATPIQRLPVAKGLPRKLPEDNDE